MSVKHVTEVAAEAVTAGSGAFKQVLIGSDEGPHFALRRFTIDPGGGMPRHTNTVEHEQYVLRGRARITIGEESYEVEEGNVVLIPAGVVHSYETVSDEPFEFLCVVPNMPDEIQIADKTG